MQHVRSSLAFEHLKRRPLVAFVVGFLASGAFALAHAPGLGQKRFIASIFSPKYPTLPGTSLDELRKG